MEDHLFDSLTLLKELYIAPTIRRGSLDVSKSKEADGLNSVFL